MPEEPELEAGYVEDAGPGFDPREQIATDLPPVEAEPIQEAILERWDEETIRQALDGVGLGLNAMVGVGETDWKMTQTDLDGMAPPLTRIANRYEPVARLAPYADPLLFAQAAFHYAARSLVARKAALIAREQAGHEGYAVDDGTPEPQEPAAGGSELGYTPFAHRTQESQ